MFKKDAHEAAVMLRRILLDHLLGVITDHGRPGADVRFACGNLAVHAEYLLYNNIAGEDLANCFELASLAGATQKSLAYVRSKIEAEAPNTLGAILTRDSAIMMCLSTECRIVARQTFTTRADVQALQAGMNEIFSDLEEKTADAMDQMTYRSLVSLHAALTAYLVATAYPLPNMVAFQFMASMPTLTMAQRLYYDGDRADELRTENNVVHPAFMLPRGVALSS